jgi:hypothetical protein
VNNKGGVPHDKWMAKQASPAMGEAEFFNVFLQKST